MVYLAGLEKSKFKIETSYISGVNGNFDDCQQIVKEKFREYASSQKTDHHYRLCAANSINWARIIGQIGMHFGTYFQLVEKKVIKCGELVNYAIPTGNFGNIYSAYLAKQMGLPIGQLILASNENNVLTEFIRDGTLNVDRELITTSSPAIDILRPSNLERFLYDLTRKNGNFISELYQKLAIEKTFQVTGNYYLQIKLKIGYSGDSQAF